MIHPVAVGSNKLKPFTHALALGFYSRVPTEGSCKRLFLCPCVNRTPHDSKHPNRGGAEEKRSQYAERLGGSSRIIWSAGRIIKPRGVAIVSMMILFIRGKVPSLSTLRCGVGGSLGKK